MNPFDLPPTARILVITLRRLGDALFATPLLASLRGAYPHATIDVLAFADSAAILTGNPHLSGIITMPPRASLSAALALALKLLGRYDLAISTQTGDRPTLFALIAGRRRVGPIDGGPRGALRRLVLSRSVAPRPGLHRLEEMLRLTDALGIARVGHLVCPGAAPPADEPTAARPPYAVVHAAPMFVYKQWHAEGWSTLAAGLRARGLAVVATGGSGCGRAPLSRCGVGWGAGCRAPRRHAVVAAIDRAHARRPRLRRAGHLRHPPCRRIRLSDGGTFRADGPAAVGAGPGRGARSHVGGSRSRHRARDQSRSSGATMSGWCSILYRASRARPKAANGMSAALPPASTPWRPHMCSGPSMRRWRKPIPRASADGWTFVSMNACVSTQPMSSQSFRRRGEASSQRRGRHPARLHKRPRRGRQARRTLLAARVGRGNGPELD